MTRHIPNIITGTRLALTPLLVYFILQNEYLSAVMTFAAICLTDVSDGAVARAFGACSRFGACMDVFTDLLYVMASLIVLNILGLMPVWFTVVVALKFIEFAVTSARLTRGEYNRNVWISDIIGRCFALLTFLSPGIICLSVLISGSAKPVEYFLLIPACAFAVTSSTIRIARCARCETILRKKRNISVNL